MHYDVCICRFLVPSIRMTQCSRCTFLNHPELLCCEICGAHLPKTVQKQISCSSDEKSGLHDSSTTSSGTNSNSSSVVFLGMDVKGYPISLITWNPLRVETNGRALWNLYREKLENKYAYDSSQGATCGATKSAGGKPIFYSSSCLFGIIFIQSPDRSNYFNQ